jgi:LysM repeat protein|tara:strand:+ start:614 stop:1753 length:1140 start_codon:yes stop_codon:yes gene_type:complete
MALPVLAIPLVLTGARTIVHRAAPIAMKLLKEGGAKRATDVIKELTSAITKSSGAGRTPVIAKGTRTVSSKSADEAASLIKAGKAEPAQKILDSLKQGFKGTGKSQETKIREKVAEAIAQRKINPKFPGGKYQPAWKAEQRRLAAKKKAAAAKKKATQPTGAAKKKATQPTGAAPKLPIGKGPKGALPTGASTSKLSFARRPGRRKSKTGLKEVGLAAGIASGVGYFAGTGTTKSVTVKAGDTLSQIAQDNNTTVAAIKKANPSITNIHRITPGQTIKVPKVKDRKSVYQGMTTAELQQPKKTTTTASKIKYGPGGYGASKSGGIVKRKSGGTVKKYKEGRTIGGASRGGASKRLPRPLPIKPKGVGAADRGWGKTGSS